MGFYLDGEDKENELKQVLGDTRTAFDLGGGAIIIFGRDGILLTNDTSGEVELSFLRAQEANCCLCCRKIWTVMKPY